MKKSSNELKVIGVPWHVGHQYELSKIFKQYDLLINFYRTWGEKSRPMPENMKEVLTFDPKDYDLAILHVDQQCTQEEMNKYKLFRDFKQATEGMKRVVINHMTPYDDRLEKIDVIERMKEIVGDIPMITNSRQAAEEWGWGNPIIHGMDASEWEELPKEPRAVTSLSPKGMATAYRRELIHETMDNLTDRGFYFGWIQNDSQLKFKTFEEYKEFLGASLIYFHGAWQSPMPRSRTEAMLCGCCIVSTRHHDWEEVMEMAEKEMGGKCGYIIPDNPKAASDLIARLLTDGYEEALEVGKRGMEFARKYFTTERWQGEWEALLRKEGFLS